MQGVQRRTEAAWHVGHGGSCWSVSRIHTSGPGCDLPAELPYAAPCRLPGAAGPVMGSLGAHSTPLEVAVLQGGGGGAVPAAATPRAGEAHRGRPVLRFAMLLLHCRCLRGKVSGALAAVWMRTAPPRLWLRLRQRLPHRTAGAAQAAPLLWPAPMSLMGSAAWLAPAPCLRACVLSCRPCCCWCSLCCLGRAVVWLPYFRCTLSLLCCGAVLRCAAADMR